MPDPWIDPHDWVYHQIEHGYQIVRCRRCGKWDSYLLVGFRPEPPRSECRAENSQSVPE